jgi:dGTPase
MDWADDIAYSVHDLDDFYRAGLIPLDRVLTDTDEQERFLMKVLNDWNRDRQTCDSPDENELKRVFTGIVELVRVPRKSLTRPYTGIREQRASLRSLTAFLIGRYIIDAVSLRRPEGGGKPYVAITLHFGLRSRY